MSTNKFRKPFDRKLYLENDKKAKEVVKEAFKNSGRLLMDNVFNEFGVDLLEVEKTAPTEISILNTVECEVKQGWTGSKYPFPTIRIPMRKMKLRGSIFCVVSSDFSHMWVIEPEVIENSSIELVSNKYSNGNKEEFISVKPEDCILVSINDEGEDDI